MAKVTAGVLGIARGAIGPVVGSLARGRAGKVNTFRQRVTPANPKSAAQTTQRTKMADTTAVIRAIGPTIYQTEWDRGVEQLPGFQSLQSILMNVIDDSYVYSAPPETPLGTLHFPDTLTIATGGVGGEIDITYSAELGSNGNNADELQVIAIRAERDADDEHPVVTVTDAAARNGSPYTLDVTEQTTDYLVVVHFEGSLGDPADRSLAYWEVVESGTD